MNKYEDIVKELEDQATLNIELDKANKYLMEENLKLKKTNEMLKTKINMNDGLGEKGKEEEVI